MTQKLPITINEEFLLKYLNNSLSLYEEKKVEEWYAASEKNKVEFQRFHKAYKLNRATKAYYKTNTEECFEEIAHLINPVVTKKMNNKSTSCYKKWAPIAAFFVGVCCTALTLFMVYGQTEKSYLALTDKGQRSEIRLADGTKIWLNSSTQVRVKQSLFSKSRIVDLDGEAYFEVTKNKGNPFIVRASGVNVKVLGTKFNVRSRKSENEVIATLLEGKVLIENSNHTNSQVLEPGQSVSVNRVDGSLTKFQYNNPGNILLWRGEKLLFEDSSLLEITQVLKQLYNLDFEFMDTDLMQETFTCEFSTNEDIEFLLSILTLTEKVNYRIDNGVVFLFKQ